MRKILTILALIYVNFSPSVGQEKKTAEYYFEKGENALDRKEYITAQAHFTECLRLNTHFADAYRLRAITREHLNEKEKALTDYNIYIDLVPGDGEALFSRAMLRYESKQYLLARGDFQTLLTLPKGATRTVVIGQERHNDTSLEIFTSESRQTNYIYNYLGLIEIKLKRFDKAIMWFDSAVKLGPNVPSFWINRGTARQERKDNAGALADFEQALKLDPENSLAIHNIASLQSATGDSEALLTEAIEKNPNMPYPRAARGYQRLQKNDLAGALDDYNQVIKIQPDAEEHYINRGIVKEKMKDIAGASQDFAKAIELNNKNERAWMSHGNIMAKTGKWQDALEDYNSIVTLNPKNAQAYYNRALAYQGLGKLKQACSDLTLAEKFGVNADVKLRGKVCK